jgi:hypothetical protein
MPASCDGPTIAKKGKAKTLDALESLRMPHASVAPGLSHARKLIAFGDAAEKRIDGSSRFRGIRLSPYRLHPTCSPVS